MKLLVTLLFAITGFSSFSQSKGEYDKADAHAKKLGALTQFNLATIADTLTRRFGEKEERARAIYTWLALNIDLDPKGTRNNDDKNNLPEKIIQLRKATPLGLSLLFQEMCSQGDVRCLSVDGYIKRTADDINTIETTPNHSWNVVQLGQSPSTWYYVDVARGAGSFDDRMTTFKKEFVSGFFFADKNLFNKAAFPDNGAWQLGTGPKTKAEFYALPVVANAAFDVGLRKIVPEKGLVKGKLAKGVAFNLNYGSDPEAVTIVTGTAKKLSAPVTPEGNATNFTFKPAKDISGPLRIYGDGKLLLIYQAEIEE